MAITNHYLFDTSTGFNDSVGSTNFTPGYGSIAGGGKINECLNWDYSTGPATSPSGPNFAISGIPNSVAFWIKLGSSVATHSQVILDQTTASVTLTTDPSNDVISVTVSYMTAFSIVLAGNTLKSWTHIVLISNGYSGWSAYVNGTFYGPYTAMSSVSPGSSATIIGGGGSGASITNSIDDLRFYYNQTISGSEVAFIYNSGSGTQLNGPGAASGSLSTITMSPPAGSATGSSGGAGSASGALSTVTMSGPAGSASSGSPGSASGLLATITVSSFSGIGGVGVTGSGSLSTITVSSFAGIGFPEFIGTGSLGTVSVTAIEAVASISTSIQLSYCACDAEIGWKQSLPITGFVSAVQGEDAISARITPVVSGTDANIVFFEQRTLTASSSYTYDLRSLTDFLGQSFSLSRAYAISVVMTSGSATISPGASNPLQWFFNSTTANVTITSGNSFMFAQKGSAIVSNSAKTILVTNPSALSACVYKIAILGGR